jgi:hypothetical protein
MGTLSSSYEQAIINGACRALNRRAAHLRAAASSQTTKITDKWGRAVTINSPEAIVMIGTANFFDDCAADVAKMRMAC